MFVTPFKTWTFVFVRFLRKQVIRGFLSYLNDLCWFSWVYWLHFFLLFSLCFTCDLLTGVELHLSSTSDYTPLLGLHQLLTFDYTQTVWLSMSLAYEAFEEERWLCCAIINSSYYYSENHVHLCPCRVIINSELWNGWYALLLLHSCSGIISELQWNIGYSVSYCVVVLVLNIIKATDQHLLCSSKSDELQQHKKKSCDCKSAQSS